MATGGKRSRSGGKVPAGRSAASEEQRTWPGNDTVLELLHRAVAVAERTEAGVNMLSTRMDSIESDLNLLNQKVGGVMELGGSVIDIKEQMQKSLRGVESKLHDLTKAQIRTYDMITAHAKAPAHVAHAAVEAPGKPHRR